MTLTRRQHDVLRLLAYGHTTPEIAAVLRLSRRTVESHIHEMLTKNGIHTRHGLVGCAYRLGILQTENAR